MRITCRIICGLGVALVLLGFTFASTPSVRAGDAPDLTALRAQYRRPDTIPFPPDNEPSPDRIALGKMLFFDPRLSGSNWISCGSCHNPGFAWGDALPKALGHGMQELGRRTPTILNTAWASALFWDGRAATLEEQALGPISSPGEMNMDLDGMVKKLESIPKYRALFAAAYPGEPLAATSVAKAIAAYERTVISGIAPFDAWVSGDADAISESAQRGFVLFNGKAQCAACHSGWRFTDDSFHDIGISGTDVGRGKFVKLDAVQYAFKTPTLRNVDERGPYMHDGCEPTLESVLELYVVGGKVKRPSLSPLIQPLSLSAGEKTDLIAFLHTLTSGDPPVTMVALPR